MGNKDPRVDAYIARSAGFARPILVHLRTLVHAACPEVEETLKWSSPHFMYKGMLCGMAAFKEHCAFGFWKEKLLRDRIEGLAVADRSAMGQFGRIAAISDLPDERTLLSLVREAVALNDRGIKAPARSRSKGNRRLTVPDYFAGALRRNRKALATFKQFSTTNKREYVDWVVEAKGEETRQRRLDTAITWMAEGKIRNWKYMRK